MDDTERFSIATRLYVRLRRLNAPAIDPMRMTRDDTYARATLADLIESAGDEEVVRMAQRLEGLVRRVPSAPTPVRQTAPLPQPETPTLDEPDPAGPLFGNRYVGALR